MDEMETEEIPIETFPFMLHLTEAVNMLPENDGWNYTEFISLFGHHFMNHDNKYREELVNEEHGKHYYNIMPAICG